MCDALAFMDNNITRRKQPNCLLVDTCVDRTFFWGSQTLQTAGIIPYKRPWFGFVHHSYDEEY